MNREKFISGLAEELELNIILKEDSILKDLDEWDSMAAMLLIGYVSNETGVTITADDLKSITTIESLIERIGIDKFK